MPYSDNMNDEKPTQRKKLLPMGWRIFKFKGGKETTSKSGNSMFVMDIEDNETGYVDVIYLVRTPGKRWVLKCVLDAFGIKRKSDGTYDYDIPDLLNKDICGLVEHEPNEFINRQGETVKTTQHKIVDFKKFEPNIMTQHPVGNPGGITDPNEVQWKD